MTRHQVLRALSALTQALDDAAWHRRARHRARARRASFARWRARSRVSLR